MEGVRTATSGDVARIAELVTAGIEELQPTRGGDIWAVRDAIVEYRLALRTKPDSLESLTSLAWLLATSPDPGMRRPAEAVQLAERAAAMTTSTDVRALDTLAAAHAATGDFGHAIEYSETALQLASGRGSAKDVALIRARLDLYRRHQPYRDPGAGGR